MEAYGYDVTKTSVFLCCFSAIELDKTYIYTIRKEKCRISYERFNGGDYERETDHRRNEMAKRVLYCS